MSGIFGIFRFDGAPLDPAWLEQMRLAMAYWGPQGGHSSLVDSVGLGFLSLEINPEDTFERQPIETPRGPVVAAARLDNREELLEAFGIPSGEAQCTPDGQLAALAFERWGEELSPHLRGDWALAAWDQRERRLFLSRDACGSATLYYHWGQGFVAFASSLKALLAIPGVPRQPDLFRMAQVLLSWQSEAERTAYEGFNRLIWAHAMVIDAGGNFRMIKHWSPEGRERLYYRQDRDYEDAFLERYERAVRSRLHTKKPVAATLSGGLDSGSVVALAGPLLAKEGRKLSTYTSVPCFAPDGADARRLGNEWALANATACMAGPNVEGRALDAAEYGVLEGIYHMLDLHDGPSHAASNHFWLQAIAETAAADGAGVVLTGQFGNATVSWAGSGSALLALRQWGPREALRVFMQAEGDPWSLLKRQILKPLLWHPRRAWAGFNCRKAFPWSSYSALNPRVARELQIESQMKATGHDPLFMAGPWESMRPKFFAPAWGIGAGLWTELGARHGISFRDPTTDLALIEFLLSVPDGQYRKSGKGRSLLLRSFQGRLPGEVLNAPAKGLQSADLGHRLLDQQTLIRSTLETLGSDPLAQRLLDLPKLHGILTALEHRVDPATTAQAGNILLRAVGVGIFLRSFYSG